MSMGTRTLSYLVSGALGALRSQSSCLHRVLLASANCQLPGSTALAVHNGEQSINITSQLGASGFASYFTTSHLPSEVPINSRKQKSHGAADGIVKAELERSPLRPLVQDGISPSIAKGQLVDDLDPLEFMIWLKERFMRQDLGLTDGVKEVIFKNHWDKMLVDVRRTIKVTRSSKLETYHAIACVGNFEGLFGVGIASSNNSQAVVGEAYLKAYQNLVPIPLYRGHTIYHRIEHKFHTVQMILMPRPEGWGIKSNDLLQELCAMIGIKNISIKVLGRRNRRNKFNVVKCFLEALQKQSTPHDGIEMMGVYAREVFHKPRLPLGLTRGIDMPNL